MVSVPSADTERPKSVEAAIERQVPNELLSKARINPKHVDPRESQQLSKALSLPKSANGIYIQAPIFAIFNGHPCVNPETTRKTKVKGPGPSSTGRDSFIQV